MNVRKGHRLLWARWGPSPQRTGCLSASVVLFSLLLLFSIISFIISPSLLLLILGFINIHLDPLTHTYPCMVYTSKQCVFMWPSQSSLVNPETHLVVVCCSDLSVWCVCVCVSQVERERPALLVRQPPDSWERTVQQVQDGYENIFFSSRCVGAPVSFPLHLMLVCVLLDISCVDSESGSSERNERTTKVILTIRGKAVVTN